jgi:NTP pyrophosphatase (non-canonical NTP hydrolase)
MPVKAALLDQPVTLDEMMSRGHHAGQVVLLRPAPFAGGSWSAELIARPTHQHPLMAPMEGTELSQSEKVSPTTTYEFLVRYQSEAARLAVYPEMRRGAIIYLGIVGESIEVMEVVHGQPASDELERELGDVLWYVAAICDELGLSMATIVQDGIESTRFTTTREFPKTWARAMVVHAGRISECFKKHLRDQDKVLRDDRMATIVECLEELTARVHLVAKADSSSLEQVVSRNLEKLVERGASIRAERAARNDTEAAGGQ